MDYLYGLYLKVETEPPLCRLIFGMTETLGLENSLNMFCMN